MPALHLLHHDEYLIVVDKPAGLLSVPVGDKPTPNLVDVLQKQMGRRVYAVHRLDEETTGCIAFATEEHAREPLEQVFRRHEAQRDYLALLSAVPSPEAGCIEAAVQEGKDGIVRVVSRGGRRAVTHYQTLERRGRGCLVRCRLDTGRRNQIRVHMAALSCPVAGDRKYGYRAREGERFARVMLHSWRLELRHPITGAPIAVESRAPEPELQV